MIESKLTELASQVQLLQQQVAALQDEIYLLEIILLFFIVSVVGAFLWKRVRDYQLIQGSAFKRARVLPPSDDLDSKS